jgi:hypothetical protein
MLINSICAGTYVRFSGGKLGRFLAQPVFLDGSHAETRDFRACKSPGRCKRGERGRKGKGKG